MNITTEPPVKSCLIFLYLSSVWCTIHVCWKYYSRLKKHVPLSSSAQSKLIKRGIAKKQPEGSLGMSGLHTRKRRFSEEVAWLKTSGYSDAVVQDLPETLLKVFLCGMSEQFEKRIRAVVILYSHKMGHNVMTSAKQFAVPVVLSDQINYGSCFSRLTEALQNGTAISLFHTKKLWCIHFWFDRRCLHLPN